jgi:hypothetical protein
MHFIVSALGDDRFVEVLLPGFGVDSPESVPALDRTPLLKTVSRCRSRWPGDITMDTWHYCREVHVSTTSTDLYGCKVPSLTDCIGQPGGC